MDQTVKMTPKDFFLNLGIVVALYTSAVTFLTLMFEIIDRVFPDVLSQGYYTYGYYSSSIRFAIASLVIMFPLVLILNYFNNRIALSVPEKKKLAIRRWLSYVTLFLASLAIAIDLITLINTFLSGEITARFVFKVLSVLLVTGVVFAYYVYDLKSEVSGGKVSKIFATATSVIVLSGIVAGFVIIGSPLTQRLRLFDERRVSDLQNVQVQVVNYWQKKGSLPKFLNDLNDSISGFSVPSDPKSGASYEYSSVNANSFKLCATFDLSTEDVNNKDYPRKDGSNIISVAGTSDYYYPYYAEQNNWTHEKGRTCFDRTIDKDIYKVDQAPARVY